MMFKDLKGGERFKQLILKSLVFSREKKGSWRRKWSQYIENYPFIFGFKTYFLMLFTDGIWP